MKSKPDPLRPLLLVVGLFALLHHVDHVLRVDHSGWPFQPEVNAFTYSLLVYPVLAVDLAARTRPRVRVGLLTAGLVLLAGVHLTIETPADIFRTWAAGASTTEANPGVANLLGAASPALGMAAVAVLFLLTTALLVTWRAALRQARSVAGLPSDSRQVRQVREVR